MVNESAPPVDMTPINPAVIEEYRRSGGVVSGDLAGLPMLLLTTTGRRTGATHTTPLGYVEDDGRFVVAASASGAPSDPDWYRNLVATPTVTVEVGSETWSAVATVAVGDERERLFARLAAALPPMAGYAATAGREIPMVLLTPQTGQAASGRPSQTAAGQPAPTATGLGLADKAMQLRALHRRGEPLVLVNAWDVASAQRVVAAGGRAVGTSSAAIAASLGLPDDPSAPVEPLFEAIRRITAAVDVPVTADLLDGYGLDPAELVDRLLAVGAVGCNLEDSDHAQPGGLLDPGEVGDRIAAVRAAATAAGVDVVINARIDSYLHRGPTATADVLARARRYLDAGADCVYPLRLTDPRVAREIVEQLDAPVNANVAGDTTVADLAAAGVSRISIGPMAFRAALARVDQLAADLLGPADRTET